MGMITNILAYSAPLTSNENEEHTQENIKKFFLQKHIEPTSDPNDYSMRDISPYDYTKKNKLDNKTEAKI